MPSVQDQSLVQNHPLDGFFVQDRPPASVDVTPIIDLVIDLDLAQGADEMHRVSLATQNALYRSILSAYAGGLSDHGALASFALDCPDDATRAMEAYQAQEKLVLEMTQEFLLSNTDNTNPLEREMDRLLRMRGVKSRPATGVVDSRGSRRKR